MEDRPPDVGVCAIKVKASLEKKKNMSEDKEAARRRRKRLRENPGSPDFHAVLAEELQKASGGGGCEDCRGYAKECIALQTQSRQIILAANGCAGSALRPYEGKLG
jgi:hypothetical protein